MPVAEGRGAMFIIFRDNAIDRGEKHFWRGEMLLKEGEIFLILCVELENVSK